MNIGEHVNFKLNEEKFNKVKEMLINELKDRNKLLIAKIGVSICDEFISDEKILELKSSIKKVNDMINIFESYSHWYSKVNLAEVAHLINPRDYSASELESKIDGVLVECENEQCQKVIQNIFNRAKTISK